MNDSLSVSLNFSVNNYPIILGNALDVPQLQAHGIDKVGFFARLLLRPEKGEKDGCRKARPGLSGCCCGRRRAKSFIYQKIPV
jgi:hypothetical protein